MSTSEDVVQMVQAEVETLFPGQYAVSLHTGERGQDDLHCLVVSRADGGERGAMFALDTEVLREGGSSEAARRFSDQMVRVIQQGLPEKRSGAYIGYDAT
ncbi:hypothetical protein [Deinococcus altitudinis]|uniref:hypothetical protein n=1 Tax=Deinococcus altitudinis TaxID=468914 RepID=UPI003891F49F